MSKEVTKVSHTLEGRGVCDGRRGACFRFLGSTAVISSFFVCSLSQTKEPRVISLISYTQDNRGSQKVGKGGKLSADAIWAPRHHLGMDVRLQQFTGGHVFSISIDKYSNVKDN